MSSVFGGLNNLISGDAWSWIESFTEYSAANYDCKVILKYKTNAAIVITAGPSNTDFLFSVPSSSTDIEAGLYMYQIKVVLKEDNSITTIEEGTIQISANLESNQDPREYWVQVVDYLKDAYKKLCDNTMLEATYNGRTFKYRDRKELIMEIENAEIKGGLSRPIPIIRERY